MTTEITTLNRMKAELARSKEQLALLQWDHSGASQSYQLRSWWLVLNAVTMLIGIVIIAGGFYMERVTVSDYLAIALNTIFGGWIVVLNANRIITSIKLRRQQAAAAEQIEALQARIQAQINQVEDDQKNH